MIRETTTVEVRLWSDQTNAETIEHIIEGRRGGINQNQELHELFGKCWHEYDLLSSFYCLKCEKQYEKFERNPNYAADPRLVLEAMREKNLLSSFLVWVWDNETVEDDLGNTLMSGDSFLKLADLILDKTGKLRDLAIEFLKEGK